MLQLNFHVATQQPASGRYDQVAGCRELSSFVFVFEGANRIVVEKPCYGHATYFFDLEEPLPVSSQASSPYSPGCQHDAYLCLLVSPRYITRALHTADSVV